MPETPAPPSGAQLQIELACHLSHVRQVAKRIAHFLEEQGCSPNDLMAWQLAVVEACNNAIQYAAKEAKTKPILVRAACSPDQIAVSIIDHTPGFDLPSNADFPAHNAEHGRGIPLIFSLIDQVEYIRGAGENVLVLRKHRATS